MNCVYIWLSISFLIAHASIDDKTSPNAFFIAQQFALASNNETFTCPFNQKLLECDPNEKYRSLDGTCNNLLNPLLGSIETPHKRLLKPEYEDGFSKPRNKASSGLADLPSPRYISLALNSDPENILELIWTNMWVTFGQFIAHDISSTALSNSSI